MRRRRTRRGRKLASEQRRRLIFRLAVDPKSDRVVAADVWPVREIMAPDGSIIELPLRGERAKKQAEAERAAKLGEQAETQPRSDGFGLVSALR